MRDDKIRTDELQVSAPVSTEQYEGILNGREAQPRPCGTDITAETEKRMAEKLRDASADKVNRNIKDSVFCDLFGRQEYLFQLYQVLHPEDKATEIDDLTIVTLSRTIARNIYNDLGFMAGNRLLVLVEAQSTWSENILVRFLMYLGETYRRYIRTNGLRIYDEKNIIIPRPELYVVFTGEREEKPETISLRECFFENDCCVDVKAKVIYDSRKDDIVSQYITFSKVFTEQYRLYAGDRVRAVQETIRICKERNVLKDYLEKEEAAAIMFTIADQEEALKEALLTEREEGFEEGEKTGANKVAALITKLFSAGRGDEVERAACDAAYREKLFKELDIR